MHVLCVLILAVAATTSVACASSGARSAPLEDGTYEFITRTGGFGDLTGRLTLRDGQPSLQPLQGQCREDPSRTGVERFRFLCDIGSEIENVTLTIDRRLPLTRSVWSGFVRQTRTRSVCDQYAMENGRQVCVRTREETYEVRTPVSGPLTFVPAT
jgi:hypothetical protein